MERLKEEDHLDRAMTFSLSLFVLFFFSHNDNFNLQFKIKKCS